MNQLTNRLSRPDLQVKYILRTYSKATQSDIDTGLNWYKVANKLCREMALKYDLRLSQVVGIVSALSPGTSWERNLIDAVALIDGLSNGIDVYDIVVTTYSINKFKAYDIFVSDLFHNDIYKLLLGSSKDINKTSSFYLNILNPTESGRVTIDRHSIRVALGLVNTPDQSLTEKRYFALQEAYNIAGAKVGISGLEIQAVTWGTFRRLFVN